MTEINNNPDEGPEHILPASNTQGLSLFFASQNVRSMNISTKNDITTQKIIAICMKNADIVLLSDLRLNCVKQVSAVNDLKKRFFLKGYHFYHNSNLPSRGVGFLISRKVHEANFRIIDIINSTDCNYMIIHAEYNSKRFAMCSVYGPNHDAEIGFYDDLYNDLINLNCPLILGGGLECHHG